MRTILLSASQMVRIMRHDKMLLVICFAPILIGILFRFGIPLVEQALAKWLGAPSVIAPYYQLVDAFYAMLTSTMFCLAAAMVTLEEFDDKTVSSLLVSPLAKEGYLASRLCIPAVASFLFTAVLLPIFKLSSLSGLWVMPLAAVGALYGLIVSMLVVAFSANKLEGVAISKLASVLTLGAVVPHVIVGAEQYAAAPLPSFWIGKATAENDLLFLLVALIVSGAWILLLLKRYAQKQ